MSQQLDYCGHCDEFTGQTVDENDTRRCHKCGWEKHGTGEWQPPTTWDAEMGS